MTGLSKRFLTPPLAHRGLHDKTKGLPENSLGAFSAAVDAGYGIELDVQCSADGQAMVFHDYDLGRLTPESGAVQLRSAAELSQLSLCNSNEKIPTLPQVLELVAGRVPVLIELKDQDGAMGKNIGAMGKSVAQALKDTPSNVAVMSFNPNAVAEMAELLPKIPRGLVTGAFKLDIYDPVPTAVKERLRKIPDYVSVNACFISHSADDLDRARVQEIRDLGAAIICWTIRDEAAEFIARNNADNITFEGYLPKHDIA